MGKFDFIKKVGEKTINVLFNVRNINNFFLAAFLFSSGFFLECFLIFEKFPFKNFFFTMYEKDNKSGFMILFY